MAQTDEVVSDSVDGNASEGGEDVDKSSYLATKAEMCNVFYDDVAGLDQINEPLHWLLFESAGTTVEEEEPAEGQKWVGASRRNG